MRGRWLGGGVRRRGLRGVWIREKGGVGSEKWEVGIGNGNWRVGMKACISSNTSRYGISSTRQRVCKRFENAPALHYIALCCIASHQPRILSSATSHTTHTYKRLRE